MMKLLTLCLTISCVIQPAANAQSAAKPAPTQTPAARSPNEKFVELQPDQLSSPFTKPTVLKLNAIVRRSKAVIDEFDHSIPAIRKAVSAGAAKSASATTKAHARTEFARVVAMRQQAAVASADMKKAEHIVRTSGEKFNDTILSAMVQFVMDVDHELANEKAQLMPKVTGR